MTDSEKRQRRERDPRTALPPEAVASLTALKESFGRADFTMFDEARAIADLTGKHALTQEEIARLLSVSQSFVANKVRLLRFLPEERALILEAGLTERHARSLLRLSGTPRREALAAVIRRRLTVAETEELVDALREALAADPTAVEKPDFVQKAETPAETDGVPLGSPSRPPILRDLRLFENSLSHAVDILRRAGVSVTFRKAETEEETEFCIRMARRDLFTPEEVR